MADPLSDFIRQAQQILKGVTAGPWTVDPDDYFHGAPVVKGAVGELVAICRSNTAQGKPNKFHGRTDAAFIAESRALVSAVAALPRSGENETAAHLSAELIAVADRLHSSIPHRNMEQIIRASAKYLAELPPLSPGPTPGTWRDIETHDGHAYGQTVLVGCGDPAWVCEAYLNDRGEWWEANRHHTDATGSAVYPTHWMPLPDPPAPRATRDAATS
jgi:hypothetical protein